MKNWKRSVAVLLALCMLAAVCVMAGAYALPDENTPPGGAVVVEDGGNPFTDVKESDYFYDAVLYAYYHDPQITNGVTDTTFSPDSTCTRAQVVTFLWRAVGKPAPSQKDNPFTDVPADAWYTEPVLWAVGEGIPNGTSDTTFSPENTCNNAAVITFLWRALGKPDDTGSEVWYEDAVNWAVKNSVISVPADEFPLDDDCPRRNIVTYIYRAMNLKENTPAPIAGGWTAAESPVITDEIKAIFDKGTENLLGVSYMPVAYLGSQIVAGTNYAILCAATPATLNPIQTYAIMYLYKDLEGKVTVTSIDKSDVTTNVKEGTPGGWFWASSPEVPDGLKDVLTKANNTTVAYDPVALLTTQVVAGTNYRLFCRAGGVDGGYEFVTLYVGFDGKGEIMDIDPFKA